MSHLAGCSSPCADCGVETYPFEMYMVTDEVWAEAGDPDGYLCVACLEKRLGRRAVPDDFARVPLNDDHEVNSVRLRIAKGSGRRVERVQEIAMRSVLEFGADVALVADRLELDAAFLQMLCDQQREVAESGKKGAVIVRGTELGLYWLRQVAQAFKGAGR